MKIFIFKFSNKARNNEIIEPLKASFTLHIINILIQRKTLENGKYLLVLGKDLFISDKYISHFLKT